MVGLVACGDNAAKVATKISVAPAELKVAAGGSLDAMASYVEPDGTGAAAADPSWSISNPAIATVTPGADGHATIRGVAAGATTLTVTGQGLTGTFMVTVTPAVLTAITITPTAPSLAAGTSVQLTATGMYSDASTADLTAMVTWSSSTTAAATVNAAGLVHGVAVGDTTIKAALGAISGTTHVTVTAATLSAIQVTPANPTLAAGTTQQLTATGVFSDGSLQDLTAQVAWTSNAEARATVSAGGLVTAVVVGSATITATKGAVSGSTIVTVSAATLTSIAVTPPTPSLARGRTLQLTATGTFTDGSTQDLTAQVTWASAAATLASVSATGLVTALAVGDARITATLGTVSGSTVVTVTDAVLDAIEVAPVNPSLANGRTLQFTATGTFSDGSTQDLTAQVGWQSSDPTVADISNSAGSQGLAKALKVGTTTISATLGAVAGTSALTVTDAVLEALEVSPTNPSVALGRSQQFTAIGRFSDASTQDLTAQVTWASSAVAIATISNGASRGLATTLAVGSTSISATLGTITGSTTLTVSDAVLEAIEVTPTSPSVALGLTQQFTATGRFSDTTTKDLTGDVTWSSSSTAVATISNAAGSAGLATTVAVGSTTIKAASGVVAGTTQLTVTAATLVSIQVTPINVSVPAGTVQQYLATGTFSDSTNQDLTTQVVWSSSTAAVATISNALGHEGQATTLVPGTTTISAAAGAISGSTTLTVTDAVLTAIEVAPINPSLAVGLTRQFTATGVFSDTTTKDLTTQATWVSADEAIAKVSNAPGSNGLATAIGAGSVAISASFGGKTGSTTLTVTGAVLVSIAIDPPDTTLARGNTQRYTATGTFSDLSSADISTQVTWGSTAGAIAQISNAPGTQGLATAANVGSTTITAQLGDVTGEAKLTVTGAALVSIAVEPATPLLAKGRTLQFVATGTFSDTTTQDLTTQVTWIAADTAIAQISNAAGSEGLASGVAAGSTDITATLNDVSGSTKLTVADSVVDSIAVAPATASVVPGGKQQYTATATFSDGHSEDLTATATWATGDPTIAQVSNAAGSQGQVTGVAVGSTSVTASSGGKTGTAAVVVVGPAVTAVAPDDGSVNVRISSPIVITFNQAIAAATLTTQTAAGPCTGSLQLSTDNFASCVAFTTATPALNTASTVATATAAGGLQTLTTYRIRVLGTVTNAGGVAIGTDLTQAAGWKTAGTCTTRVVVSQVYGGGGNSGGQFRNDFIELHNIGTTPVSLSGFAVQFISAAGTGAWAVQALPATASIPAGGYFLIQEAAGANAAAPPLPAPDFTPTTPVTGGVPGFAIGATSGKVALTPTLTPLTGSSCATLLAAATDLVGFGGAASCSEGAPAPAPSNTTSVQRTDGGCDDTNANNLDFVAAAPVPRNSAVTAAQCSCPVAPTLEAPVSWLSTP